MSQIQKLLLFSPKMAFINRMPGEWMGKRGYLFYRDITDIWDIDTTFLLFFNKWKVAKYMLTHPFRFKAFIEVDGKAFERELENIESYNGNLKNIDCVVTTGREELVGDITAYWLEKHFKFDGNLYLTNWDNDYKVENVLQQKPQIYVDDNAKLLDKIKKCNPEISLYLVAQPWNKTSLRGIEDETGIVRINEIYELLSKQKVESQI